MKTYMVNAANNTYAYYDNWPVRVTKTENGYTEVSLDYQLDTVNPLVELTVQDNLVMSHGTSGKNFTFRDLEKIPDFQWKENIPSQAYLVYQQPINLVDTVNKLMRRRPISAVSNRFCTQIVLLIVLLIYRS